MHIFPVIIILILLVGTISAFALLILYATEGVTDRERKLVQYWRMVFRRISLGCTAALGLTIVAIYISKSF